MVERRLWSKVGLFRVVCEMPEVLENPRLPVAHISREAFSSYKEDVCHSQDWPFVAPQKGCNGAVGR